MIKIILFIILCSNYCFAKKWIELDWEEVQGASSYEVELSKKVGDTDYPLGVFKSKKASFKKEIAPGFYKLRFRSLDSREVPGVWSNYVETVVKVDGVTGIRPAINEEIESLSLDKKLLVNFVWEKIIDVDEYKVSISREGKAVFEENVKSVETSLHLLKGYEYQWKVDPIINGKVMDSSKWSRFSILLSPELSITSNIFQEKKKLHVQSSSEGFDFYTLVLRKDGKKVFRRKTKRKNTYLNLKKIKKGNYVLSIQGHKKLSSPSYPSNYEFSWNGKKVKLKGNDRLDRSLLSWSLSAKAQYLIGDYRSVIQQNLTNFNVEMPGIGFGLEARKRFKYFDIWGNFFSPSYTSSSNNYKFTSLDLGVDAFKFKFYDFRLSLILGYRWSNFYIIIPDSLNNTNETFDKGFKGGSFGFNLNYLLNDIWRFDLLFILSKLGLNDDGILDYNHDSAESSKLKVNVNMKYSKRVSWNFELGFNSEEHIFNFLPNNTKNTFSFDSKFIGVGADFFF